jgi:hypothetical protein
MCMHVRGLLVRFVAVAAPHHSSSSSRRHTRAVRLTCIFVLQGDKGRDLRRVSQPGNINCQYYLASECLERDLLSSIVSCAQLSERHGLPQRRQTHREVSVSVWRRWLWAHFR